MRRARLGLSVECHVGLLGSFACHMFGRVMFRLVGLVGVGIVAVCMIVGGDALACVALRFV